MGLALCMNYPHCQIKPIRQLAPSVETHILYPAKTSNLIFSREDFDHSSPSQTGIIQNTKLKHAFRPYLDIFGHNIYQDADPRKYKKQACCQLCAGKTYFQILGGPRREGNVITPEVNDEKMEKNPQVNKVSPLPYRKQTLFCSKS